MTEKLFYSMPYCESCFSNVQEIIELEDKFIVVLDKTIFYPEGGGQSCDLGTIDNIQVIDVYEKEDIVFHVLKLKPEKEIVECKIDFIRRFDHMQQHSGEHLLASMFYNLYGIQSTGFHLGTDYVSIDLLVKDLKGEEIRTAETRANEYIYKNLDIKTYIADAEKAKALPLRKTPKVDQGIRIVEIDEVDFSPCCGTHVKNTGEIGILKIIKVESYKGMVRVYFKSGKRALLDLQQKTDALYEVCKYFSTSEIEIVSKAKSIAEELNQLHREVRKLNDDIALEAAQKLISENSPKVIFKKFEDKTFDYIQTIAKYLTENTEKAIILYSFKDMRLIYSYNGSGAINCGKVFKENITNFSGRGGGNNKQAQGSFFNVEEMDKFANKLLKISDEILSI